MLFHVYALDGQGWSGGGGGGGGSGGVQGSTFCRSRDVWGERAAIHITGTQYTVILLVPILFCTILPPNIVT